MDAPCRQVNETRRVNALGRIAMKPSAAKAFSPLKLKGSPAQIAVSAIV